MGSIYLLVALFCSPALAIPIPDPLVSIEAGSSPLALVLGLCAPFLILSVVKYAYMKYRRAESIHTGAEQAEVEAEVKSSPALIGLGLEHKILNKDSRKSKLHALSGYLVGMLGSPEWETRVKVRMDRAIRKSHSQRSSVDVPSRAVSPSTATRSRFDSSHRSRDTSVGYKSSRHAPSNTSSKSRTMSLSFLEMYSPDSNIINQGASRASSPPVLDNPPQLPSLHDANHTKVAATRPNLTSMSSLSPTLMQMIEPAVGSWQDDAPGPDRSQSTGGTGRSRSHSPTPPFQTPPTTPAKSSTSASSDPASGSSRSGDESSRSTISTSGDDSSVSLPRIVTTAPNARPQTGRPEKTTSKPTAATLHPTTRPLNIDPSRLQQGKSDTDYRSANAAKYIAERSVADKVKPSRRKSGSPSIGPSPLRNPLTTSSSSSSSNVKGSLGFSRKAGESRPSPVSSVPDTPSWELDDLMKNGRLDIDAVTEALGLGFSLTDSSSSSVSRSRSPTTYTTSLSESFFRKPGRPLCAIPEEPDVDESALDIDEDRIRPLSSLIERWGRIQQKFTVESAAGEVRESVSSSILEVDLSLLGLDVSAISGIGTPVMLSRPEESYRDTTYTIEALDVDEDSSSGWLEDSNVSSEGVGVAC